MACRERSKAAAQESDGGFLRARDGLYGRQT